jgi:hypothetical protein
MRLRTAIASTLLAALAGCAGCDSVPDSAVTDCEAQIVPGGAATDILLVIDDSGSMSQEQQELADNLGQFIGALVNAPVRLDVRIGVTNTSIHGYGGETSYGAGEPSDGKPYPAGALVAVEQDAQGVGTPGVFVFDPATSTTFGGARILANGPNLVRDFKANVLQGTWGSGKEQPLEVMKLALEEASCPAGVNCGFQRAGARLAVVVVTDEDDCSAPAGAVTSDTDCHNNPGNLNQLQDYLDFIGSTAFDDGGAPIFALIAGFDSTGTTPALCNGSTFVPPTTTSAAAVPNRLDQFVDLLDAASPGRTLRKSICGSFGPSLLQIASMLIPQDLPLEQAPADWQMMAVAIDRGGATVPCPLALEGSAAAASAGAVFTPPLPGRLARIHFQGACTLGVGDRVDVSIVCAR